jgi:hypothetical protein
MQRSDVPIAKNVERCGFASSSLLYIYIYSIPSRLRAGAPGDAERWGAGTDVKLGTVVEGQLGSKEDMRSSSMAFGMSHG